MRLVAVKIVLSSKGLPRLMAIIVQGVAPQDCRRFAASSWIVLRIDRKFPIWPASVHHKALRKVRCRSKTIWHDLRQFLEIPASRATKEAPHDAPPQQLATQIPHPQKPSEVGRHDRRAQPMLSQKDCGAKTSASRARDVVRCDAEVAQITDCP